jgi:hypothetical protein
MSKLHTADDIEVYSHDQGSAAYDRAGGPVIEVCFPEHDTKKLSLAAAEMIGRAAARLAPTPSQHPALPVAGYTPKSDDEIALVNEGKQLEERVLRYIEKVEYRLRGHMDGPGQESIRTGDARFLAIGKTDIQKGFMMVYRSVFNPGRARLPEDTPAAQGVNIEIIEADRPD